MGVFRFAPACNCCDTGCPCSDPCPLPSTDLTWTWQYSDIDFPCACTTSTVTLAFHESTCTWEGSQLITTYGGGVDPATSSDNFFLSHGWKVFCVAGQVRMQYTMLSNNVPFGGSLPIGWTLVFELDAISCDPLVLTLGTLISMTRTRATLDTFFHVEPYPLPSGTCSVVQLFNDPGLWTPTYGICPGSTTLTE